EAGQQFKVFLLELGDRPEPFVGAGVVLIFPAQGRSNHEEPHMNWNRVEGNWEQFKGKVQAKWGELTGDDLDVIAGNRKQLVGKIQERYGKAQDAAEREIDDW